MMEKSGNCLGGHARSVAGRIKVALVKRFGKHVERGLRMALVCGEGLRRRSMPALVTLRSWGLAVDIGLVARGVTHLVVRSWVGADSTGGGAWG